MTRRRRLRVGDLLLALFATDRQAALRRQVGTRRRRAAAGRRGSLTYSRQQALRLWQQQGGPQDGPYV